MQGPHPPAAVLFRLPPSQVPAADEDPATHPHALADAACQEHQAHAVVRDAGTIALRCRGRREGVSCTHLGDCKWQQRWRQRRRQQRRPTCSARHTSGLRAAAACRAALRSCRQLSRAAGVQPLHRWAAAGRAAQRAAAAGARAVPDVFALQNAARAAICRAVSVPLARARERYLPAAEAPRPTATEAV